MWQKETKKTEDSDAFSEVEHKHDNLVPHHAYTHGNKSIIYVTSVISENNPSTSYPAAKHLKTASSAFMLPKTFRDILVPANQGFTFAPCNNFAHFGSFAKVSGPVKIYNSLLCHTF